jgi:hypothetical protein
MLLLARKEIIAFNFFQEIIAFNFFQLVRKLFCQIVWKLLYLLLSFVFYMLLSASQEIIVFFFFKGNYWIFFSIITYKLIRQVAAN